MPAWSSASQQHHSTQNHIFHTKKYSICSIHKKARLHPRRIQRNICAFFFLSFASLASDFSRLHGSKLQPTATVLLPLPTLLLPFSFVLFIRHALRIPSKETQHTVPSFTRMDGIRRAWTGNFWRQRVFSSWVLPSFHVFSPLPAMFFSLNDLKRSISNVAINATVAAEARQTKGAAA